MGKKTKPIVIRVPIALSDRIDRYVEQNILYTSKPDFIMTGVLETFVEISDFFNLVLAQMDKDRIISDQGIKSYEYNLETGVIFHDQKIQGVILSVAEYKKYKGETKPVSLYLPDGLINEFKTIRTLFDLNISLPDLCKAGVIRSIEKYEQWIKMYEYYKNNSKELMDLIKKYNYATEEYRKKKATIDPILIRSLKSQE